MRDMRKVTGSLAYEEAPLSEEEWKEAVVLGVLVQRNGGPIRIPVHEVLALRGCTIHVEHHMYADELVIGLAPTTPPGDQI